ncbi:hypothetical protein [Dactylosporangium sp. CA-092794]|uniref:hypothetical protein n=1 Tax=Dactylosporangium sp. CA-092794 TaxID=3239929 RepID=UPI003D8E12D9
MAGRQRGAIINAGDASRTRGLRQLLRLQRMRDASIDFLSIVAERIVAVAHPTSAGLDPGRLRTAAERQRAAVQGPGSAALAPSIVTVGFSTEVLGHIRSGSPVISLAAY